MTWLAVASMTNEDNYCATLLLQATNRKLLEAAAQLNKTTCTEHVTNADDQQAAAGKCCDND